MVVVVKVDVFVLLLFGGCSDVVLCDMVNEFLQLVLYVCYVELLVVMYMLVGDVNDVFMCEIVVFVGELDCCDVFWGVVVG